MKFSCQWLSESITLPDLSEAGIRELAARLTAAGLAVEYVERAGEDFVLDIDVTTNRPDAMCHHGLARDLSALLDLDLRFPACTFAEGAETAASAVSVTIEDARCPRYAARILRGVRVGPSPAWLAARLAAIGLRSINNVVDVTNYVLWELGQPLHAFDLATIPGGEIRVRAARAGETLITLDGVARELDPEVLVIADRERAVALAGIMGGLDTEVTAGTTDVLLESAHFDPKAVRRGAKRLGMHTDASHRFERGADPELCARALDRAAHLLVEVAGGTVLAGVVDARWHGSADWCRSGRLTLDGLAGFMGVEVETSWVERWFARLGFELAAESPAAWRVRVPSWRYYDFQPVKPTGLVYEADLYEEAARLHGLDDIPSALPAIGGSDAPASPELVRRRKVADVLAAAGFAEAIHYAFCDSREAAALPRLRPEAGLLALANPLSEHYDVMRPSLLPGLLEAARFNLNRGAEAVRLFEIGKIFVPRHGERFPEELETVGVVLGGARGTPWERRAELDFFDLKGVLEELAAVFGVDLTPRAADLVGLVPGATAEIVAGGQVVGTLGRLAGEDGTPLYAGELLLAALGTGAGRLTVQPPPRLPGVAVDLTLTHPLAVSWTQLVGVIEEVAPADLRSVALKDRYQGKGVPRGAVNTTLAFVYNAAERSLTQDEVNERQMAVARALETRFGWKADSQATKQEADHGN